MAWNLGSYNTISFVPKKKQKKTFDYTRWYCCSCSPGSFNQCPRYYYYYSIQLVYLFFLCPQFFLSFTLSSYYILLYQFFQFSFWERKQKTEENLPKKRIIIMIIIWNPFDDCLFFPPWNLSAPHLRSAIRERSSWLSHIKDTHTHTLAYKHNTEREREGREICKPPVPPSTAGARYWILRATLHTFHLLGADEFNFRCVSNPNLNNSFTPFTT